jgi:hypothetical protein
MQRITVKLNDEELKRYQKGEQNGSIVWDVANRSGYSPFGYGFYTPTITHKEGEFFATWTCGSSCD